MLSSDTATIESPTVLLRIALNDGNPVEVRVDPVSPHRHERRGEVADAAAEVVADLTGDPDLVGWLDEHGRLGAVVPDWAAFWPQPDGAAVAVAVFTIIDCSSFDIELLDQGGLP